MELHNTDCLDFLRAQPANSVDLILTDPPYGMSYQSSHRKQKFAKIEGDDSCEVFLDALPLMVRALRPDRHAYFFCSWHNVDVFKQAVEQSGLTIKNILIWNKNNHGAGDLRGSYAPKYEMIIFAHKGRRLLRGKRIADVIECAKVAAMVHPTEKPVALLERFIAASTDAGEIVLDPFAGSGTTGMAALALGREFIGTERDPTYFDIARGRLAPLVPTTSG